MKSTTIPRTEALETTHIVRTLGVSGGKPRIEGHRIKVEHIAVCYERMGMSADQIVTGHPTITLAQVHAALPITMIISKKSTLTSKRERVSSRS